MKRPKVSLFFILLCLICFNFSQGQCLFKSVSCGRWHTMAIAENGTLWGWGQNVYGQLGDGTFNDKDRPTLISNSNDWKSVHASDVFTLLLKTDGTLWACGYNFYGELGLGNKVPKGSLTKVGTDNTWEFISVGEGYCLGIKKDGSLWSWGYNSYGLLGIGTDSDTFSLLPIRIGKENFWKSVWNSGRHILCLKNDGSIWSWGENSDGQLGNSPFFVGRNAPYRIGQENDWIEISLSGFGYNNTLAVKADGTLWVWGDGKSFQFGNPEITRSNMPIQIGKEKDWKYCSIGYGQLMAIKKDNSLWSWGVSEWGKLGQGKLKEIKYPKNICCNLTAYQFNKEICHNDTVYINQNQYYFGKAIGSDTLENYEGCDSIINIEITFYQEDTTLYLDTVCHGEVIIINGILFNKEKSTDIIRLVNSKYNGCDSILSVQFHFLDSISIDEEILKDSQSINLRLKVNGGLSPYKYKWSTGDSTNSVTLNMNGIYSVTVTDDHLCSSIKIYYFKTTESEDVKHNLVQTFQNENEIIFNSSDNAIVNIIFYTISGQVITSQINNSKKCIVNKNILPEGLIIAIVKLENGNYKNFKLFNNKLR